MMSTSQGSNGLAPVTAVTAHTSLQLLVTEASRQFEICNACRYCEGLCAVFPALERRTVFGGGDVSQIANLCHDCRACFDACMYAPPHVFAVNIPPVLAAVRVRDHEQHTWPRHIARPLAGRLGIGLALALAILIVLAVAAAHAGLSALVAGHTEAASPYDLVPYWALMIMLLVPAAFAVMVTTGAARSYWRSTATIDSARLSLRAIADATRAAATLRYQRGGGRDCFYPQDDMPSPVRRRLHHATAYGFGLCFASTVAAGIAQDILGDPPPYPWVSVPVVAGVVGGVGLFVGCAGLLWLKSRSSKVTGFEPMTVKDDGLLVCLTFLAVTGLATLFSRNAGAFGILFLVHLAAVMCAFAAMPYSKFMHVVYRYLALMRDQLERDARKVATPTGASAQSGDAESTQN